MKQFKELSQEEINKAFEAAELVLVAGDSEAYFFQDETHCILLTRKQAGIWVQIKGKRDREYKTYGVMQTLQTAYDTALELIDANEL